MNAPAHYALSTSNERYTPPRYIEAARAVLGRIDYDPASCEAANKIVQATTYSTIKHDSLTEDNWAYYDEQIVKHPSRVWLNSPGGRRYGDSGEFNQKLFSERLIKEYKAGHVETAILLVTAATSEMWFQPLLDYMICFATRFNFIAYENGEYVELANGDTKGRAFIYFPPLCKKDRYPEISKLPHYGRFIKHFAPFGRIVVPPGNVILSHTR